LYYVDVTVTMICHDYFVNDNMSLLLKLWHDTTILY